MGAESRQLFERFFGHGKTGLPQVVRKCDLFVRVERSDPDDIDGRFSKAFHGKCDVRKVYGVACANGEVQRGVVQQVPRTVEPDRVGLKDFELRMQAARGDNAGVPHDFPVSKFRWIWPVILAALIFTASSRSEVAGPSIPGIDKVAHFAVYGLLGTLVLRAMRRPQGRHKFRAAWVSVLIVSVYGLSDEWHQSFTPGRDVEAADWIADTLGGALAVTLYSCWGKYRRVLEMPILARRERRVENAEPVATVSPS